MIGGGLLGLEAANALQKLGMKDARRRVRAAAHGRCRSTTPGGAVLRRRIEELGVVVHTATVDDARSSPARRRASQRCRFADGAELRRDLVVFSAGIRPRDELARARRSHRSASAAASPSISAAAPSDPDIFAIGECALVRGAAATAWSRPATRWRAPRSRELTGGDELFTGFDMSTKLKLLGVDVASFGDAFARSPARTSSASSTARERLQEAGRLAPTASACWAACSSATPRRTAQLLQLAQNQIVLPPRARKS